MGMSEKAHVFLQRHMLQDIRRRGAEAYYDLGVAYSMGRGDVPIDLVQAHKWFNLAAMAGLRQAQEDRASVAADMTGAEIAEAQRQARTWLAQDGLLQAA